MAGLSGSWSGNRAANPDSPWSPGVGQRWQGAPEQTVGDRLVLRVVGVGAVEESRHLPLAAADRAHLGRRRRQVGVRGAVGERPIERGRRALEVAGAEPGLARSASGPTAAAVGLRERSERVRRRRFGPASTAASAKARASLPSASHRRARAGAAPPPGSNGDTRRARARCRPGDRGGGRATDLPARPLDFLPTHRRAPSDPTRRPGGCAARRDLARVGRRGKRTVEFRATAVARNGSRAAFPTSFRETRFMIQTIEEPAPRRSRAQPVAPHRGGGGGGGGPGGAF